MPRRTAPPLWACPKCGARFASANLSHSCGRFDRDALFARSDPIVRRRRLGPRPRLQKIEDYGPNSILHLFRIDRPEDLDASLQRLVREAYARGTQNHLFVAPQ
jgi:hypothetical protein